VRSYLRLLRYLRPYLGRFVLALACMAVFGVMNFASLGMISPLMSVLFRSGAVVTQAPAAAAVAPVGVAVPLPTQISALGERWIVRASPLVALERICLILVLVFVLKNVADYL